MTFIISAKTYTPAPEGVHQAVCVDVVDLGQVDGPFGRRQKCRLVFELDKKMINGAHFITYKTYTASMNEKSSLHKDLRVWRGKPFTAEELKGFDVEQVIGKSCQVAISHVEKDGTVYGNITAIMKPDKGKAYPASGSYKRAEVNGNGSGNGSANNKAVADYDDSNLEDDGVPF
jgi:hypothetical protein